MNRTKLYFGLFTVAVLVAANEVSKKTPQATKPNHPGDTPPPFHIVDALPSPVFP